MHMKTRPYLLVLSLLLVLSPDMAQAFVCPTWILDLARKLSRPGRWKQTISSQTLTAGDPWLESISPEGRTVAISDAAAHGASIYIYTSLDGKRIAHLQSNDHSADKGIAFADDGTLVLARADSEPSSGDFRFFALDCFRWDKISEGPLTRLPQQLRLRVPNNIKTDSYLGKIVQIGKRRFLDTGYEMASGEKMVDRFELTEALLQLPAATSSIDLAAIYHLKQARFPGKLNFIEPNQITQRSTGLAGVNQKERLEIFALGSASDGSDAKVIKSVSWPAESRVSDVIVSSDQSSVFISSRNLGVRQIFLTGKQTLVEDLARQGKPLVGPMRSSAHLLTAVRELGIILICPSYSEGMCEIRDLKNGNFLGFMFSDDWPVVSLDGSTLAELYLGRSRVSHRLRTAVLRNYIKN
jgi:hypothetical protein